MSNVNIDLSLYKMRDTIDSYLTLEDLQPTLHICEDGDDPFEPAISKVQEHHNHLQERFIALKAFTETLKSQIRAEKELWAKELLETAKVESEIRQNQIHAAGEPFGGMSEEEYMKKMDMFKDFMFFTRATEDLEHLVRKNSYQHWLVEVENKCSMELLRIKESMIILKPLKDMASKWNENEPKAIEYNASSSHEDGKADKEVAIDNESLQHDTEN